MSVKSLGHGVMPPRRAYISPDIGNSSNIVNNIHTFSHPPHVAPRVH